MANSPSNPGDIFDVKKIRRLVELMNEHDLAEIDLRQSDQRIRIRRGAEPVVTSGDTRHYVPAPAPAPSTAAPTAPATKAAEDDANVVTIKSPMVGTFYQSSSPDTPAFVKVGDHVNAETIVCIIEAMKVFNEIPAEVSGRVVAVLVENQEPVGYGQPLFKVDTRK